MRDNTNLLYIINKDVKLRINMKKTLLTILSILILATAANAANTKVNSDLANAIRLYKTANYAECYSKLKTIVKKDPSNALAYYYLAMSSAQIGNKSEAVVNYEKAIALAPSGSNLDKYARKGKTCLINPGKCNEVSVDSETEAFIKGNGFAFSEKVKSDYERLKIENMMREMNRSDDIPPQEFKEFRDFSSMNTQGVPTNDEIVAAMRTLQRAGFGNILNTNNGYSDISVLLGNSQQNNTALNQQLIQAMLTNNMSLGF